MRDQLQTSLSHREPHSESQTAIASVPPVLLPAHCMLTLIQLPGDLGDNSGSQCSPRDQGLATAPFDPDLNCTEDRWGGVGVGGVGVCGGAPGFSLPASLH